MRVRSAPPDEPGAEFDQTGHQQVKTEHDAQHEQIVHGIPSHDSSDVVEHKPLVEKTG